MKIAFALLLALTAAVAHAEHYGAPLTMKNPISLPAAIKLLEAKPTAAVLIESQVDKVCEAKGCWLGLVSTQDNIRVTFKDYAFFVPPSLIGKTVVVQGQIEKITMTLEETKHYVKDAGGDPAKVTMPRVEYRVVATGVEVRT